jgi:hypothetical protein
MKKAKSNNEEQEKRKRESEQAERTLGAVTAMLAATIARAAAGQAGVDEIIPLAKHLAEIYEELEPKCARHPTVVMSDALMDRDWRSRSQGYEAWKAARKAEYGKPNKFVTQQNIISAALRLAGAQWRENGSMETKAQQEFESALYFWRKTF